MSIEGEITYEIRVYDGKLKSDLAQANKKIEQSAKETAKKTEGIGKDTALVKKNMLLDVTKYNEQQNKKQEQSDKNFFKIKEVDVKEYGEKLKSISSSAASAIGTGMLKAGTAMVDIGTMAVGSANDVDKAMNQYLASTGRGTEETERYQKVMENIYTNNYGDSFEEIGQAMTEVTKNLGDLDDASLQQVTESAFALRDTFGYEVPESTKAAKAMMDNFGISGEEAMSLIAAGAQNGLDCSGELLDSITQYSGQFAKVGLDADDMFQIFQKGAESGAFNLNQVGDAVTEMTARVVDGSESTTQGFEAIGLNADEMAAKFSAGGESAKEAFDETIAALASMEDPLAQNQAGAALFGSTWENLGPEAVAALADIEDGAYDTAGAMASIKDIKYDDIGSVFEGLKRSLEVLLIPLGEQLIPLLADLIDNVLPLLEEAFPPIIDAISGVISAMLPAVEEVLPALMDALSQLGEPLMQIVEEVLPILLDAFNEVMPLFADLAAEILPVIAEVLSGLLPPLVELISGLLPVFLEVVSSLMPIFETVIELLEPILELFINLLDPIIALAAEGFMLLVEILGPIIELFTLKLIPALQIFSEVFSSVFSGMFETATDVIGNVRDILEGIIDFVKNVFSLNWRGAWQNIVDIFESIVSAIGSIFKAPLNLIIDGINGFINGINRIKLPDWAPFGLGGKGFHIPNIPRLKIGIDYVPWDMFPAYLDKGEWVLTKEEADYMRSIGGLEGMADRMESVSQDAGSVVVQSSIEIDYKKLGNAVADAITRSGIGVKYDNRVFGRIVKDVIDGYV